MPPSPGQNQVPRSRFGLKASALLIPLLVLVGYVWWTSRVNPPPGVSRAEYQRAAAAYRDRHGRDGDRMDVLSSLAQRAVRDSRFEVAVACLREIPTSDPEHGFDARFRQAQAQERLNQADAAERNFRECLALGVSGRDVPEQDLAAAYQWLVFLLSVELRFEERKEVLRTGHELGLARVWDSRLYFFPHLLIWHSPDGRVRLERYLERDPGNRQLRTALARYLTIGGEYERARELLEELHTRDPADLHCAAALLEFCYEQADWTRFDEVLQTLPPFAEGEPWLLTRMRGEAALNESRWEDAILQFERVLHADPSNPWSHAGLARALGGLNREADREAMLARSLELSRISTRLNLVTERNPAACRELADTCDQLGFADAAEAFRSHALRTGP